MVDCRIGAWEVATIDAENHFDPAVALADSGGVHIAYCDGAGNGLKYAYKAPGGGWTFTHVVARGATRSANVVVASDGGVHVTWAYDASGGLQHGRRTSDGSWVIASIEGGDVGKSNVLRIDASGTLHVAYWSRATSTVRYGTQCGGASWRLENVERVSGAGSAYSRGVGLAVTEDGTAHVTYFGARGSFRHAERGATSAWKIEEVSADSGQYTSLAVDREGHLHVVYDTGILESLAYSERDATATWSRDILGSFYGSASIQVMSSGTEHLVYGTSADEIVYATRGASGSLRTDEMHTTEGWPRGSYPALAVSPTGELHVVYRANSGALVYARRPASSERLREPPTPTASIARRLLRGVGELDRRSHALTRPLAVRAGLRAYRAVRMPHRVPLALGRAQTACNHTRFERSHQELGARRELP